MTFVVPKQSYSNWHIAVCKVAGHNTNGYWAKAKSASEKGCTYSK